MRPEQRTGDEEITTRRNSSSTTTTATITTTAADDDAADVVVAVVGTAGGRERSFHSQETEKASGSCSNKKKIDIINRDDDDNNNNDVDEKMLRTRRIVESQRLWEEKVEEKVEVVMDGVVAVATAADRIRLLVERDLSTKNEPKVILGALYRLSQMCACSKRRRSRKSSNSSNDVVVDNDDDDDDDDVVVAVVEGCEGGQRQARINRFILYQSRAYVFVIRAMEKYAHHALVQAWGCHVLGLCSGDSSSTGIDDPSTTARATTATATTAIVGMGGIQAILHAMTKFPNDQPLQFQACKALNKVTANNKEGLTLFVKLDGIRAVVSTMKRFPSSEYIQARSGSLLCSCCCCCCRRTTNSEFHRKQLKEAKAASAILEACENHPNSQAIRKWARPIFKTLLNL